MVDIACIPGTSVFSVLIVNDNGYSDQNGNTYPGETRFMFLNTLSTSMQVTLDAVDVPTSQGAFRIFQVILA